MADVFMSYSRRDTEFVRRLAESISGRGKEVWLDTEGIADGEVFPEAIKRAIEQADAFLFVITPASVASSYCESEVEYAREMQKRIVPVLRDSVEDDELPVEIRDRNWVPFTDDAQFAPSLERLVRALDTDLEAAKAHTRWLVKALEWDTESREGSFLLRGAELAAAEQWLAASPEGADPAPLSLQREYLLASRTAAARRQRMLVGASMAVALVSVGLLVFALISRGQAVSEKVAARAQALAAESQAQLPNDPEISLILGMRAVREQATPQTLFALRAALDASPLELGLPTVAAPGSCGANSGLSAAYSPDGQQIAEAACNGSLALLHPATGRVLRSEHIGSELSSLAYAPNGALLAVGTAAGITLLDPHTGTVRARLTGQPMTSALAFSPDGRLLAADSPAGVTVWRLSDGHARTLARDPNEDGNMVFSRDGRLLIVGGGDASAHIFDVASGRLVHRIVDPGQSGISWPEVVALSPDGGELAVGYPSSEAGEVSIYSTNTWAKQREVTSIAQVEISALAFSPGGGSLAVGGEDGTAGIWSTSSEEQLATYDGATAAVTAMAFAPDGRSVLSAANDGVARIWRAAGTEQALLAFSGGVDSLALKDGVLSVLRGTPTGSAVSSVGLPGGGPLRSVSLPGVAAVGLSPDGRFVLATASTTGDSMEATAPVDIWSASDGRIVYRLAPAAINVDSAQFSPDDSRVAVDEDATNNTNGRAVIVTLADDRTIPMQQPGSCGALPPFAFSDNGRLLAASSYCGYVYVWDTATGRLRRRFDEGGEVSDVGLNTDGSRLLVSSWDSRATIWSVASGHPLVNLIGDTRGISEAALSPDGSLVATESLDHTVRIWDARTGQQLRVLTFTHNQAQFVFSADGRHLAIVDNPPGTAASIVRIFETCPACEDSQALLALAAPHATKELTTLERAVIDGS
jgi:WD40 repeat protein